MIIRDVLTDVLSAVRAALANDGVLSAIVGRDNSGAVKIYTRPPAHVAMPFLILGDFSTLDDGSSDTDAQHVIFDIGCWDQSTTGMSPNQTNVRAMMARVRALFHMQPDFSGARTTWTIPNQNLILARVTGSPAIQLQPDGISNHAIVTLDILVGHQP